MTTATKELRSGFTNPEGEAEYMAAYAASMRLWPVEYEPKDIRTRFGSTHLVSCGPEDAPPLILLHCFFTSLTNWAYNIADFSRDHRVYALDIMGQPSKSIPDEPIRNWDEMTEWLTGVVDALGLDRTDLLGYSYGAGIALNYAIHAPNRVKKLVLLSPAGGLVPLKTQFYIRSMPAGVLPSRLLKRLAMKSFMNWTVYQPNLRNEKMRRFFNCMVDQMTIGSLFFRRQPFVFPITQKDEDLRSLKTPTLLLVGQQEVYFDPVAAVRRAEQMIPDIRTELIPQASHEMPNSQPNAVDSKVLDFLRGVLTMSNLSSAVKSIRRRKEPTHGVGSGV